MTSLDMTINEIQDEIIENFSFLENWEQKYEYIISLGKNLKEMPEEGKQDKYIIKGCQSKVWIYPKMENNKLFFYADSDTVITKGIISLILSVVSGHNPKDIISTDLYFVEKIKITEFLSPNRANGLISMIKQIKLYATVFELKS